MRNGIIAAIVVVIAAAGVFYFLQSTAERTETTPAVSTAPAVPDDGAPALTIVSEGAANPDRSEGSESAIEQLMKNALEDESESSYKPRPIKIYGTVADAATGEPIAGAMIYTDSYLYMVESLDEPDFDEEYGYKGTEDTDPEELRELLAAGKGLPANYQKAFDTPTAISDESGAYSLTVDSVMEESVYCRGQGFAVDSRELNRLSPENMRVDFQLRRGATVSGKVTDLANGEPVADVSVVAVSDADMEDIAWVALRYGSMDTATTMADGTYTIGGLSQGLNQIAVRDKRHGWIFDPARIVNVTLGAGEQKAGIDLVVSQGLRAAGRVINESGEPVENAVIEARLVPSGAYDPYMRDAESPVVKSDATGAFVIVGLRAGKSAVSVSHDDYADRSTSIEIVEGKETPKFDVTLVRGSSVSGLAKYEDGRPALTAMLFVSREDEMDDEDPFDLATRDSLRDSVTGVFEENGSFTFEHVPAGKYILSTTFISRDEEDNPNYNALPKVRFEVDGKNDVTGLEIIVPDERPKFSVAEGKITGTVLDRNGKPAANVGVRTTFSEFAEIDMGPEYGPESVTDANGAFTVELYSADEPQTVYAESDLGEASQDNVKNGDNITLRLGPLTGVSGEVVDAEGNAVARCKVVLSQAAGEEPETFGAMMSRMMGDVGGLSRSASTDDFGQFTFKHIQPGDFTIEATSAGQGFGTSDRISISKGTEKSGVRIVLEAGVTFSGVVVDGSGKAVPGANVSLNTSTDNPMETMMAGMPADMMTQPVGIATSGVDGMFSMSGLKPGSYVLRAQHADFAPYTEQGVALSADQATPHRVILGKGGAAHGQFLVDGKPKANMMIQLMGDSGMHMARTDSDGRFEVKGLPAGNYMVMPIDMDAMEDEEEGTPQNMSFKSVTITEGGDAVITFGTGVAVNGTVPTEGLGKSNYVYLMRKGSPDIFANMSGMAPMEMMSMGMQLMQHAAGMAEINSDGSFQLPQIDPGDYDLRVYASDMDFDEFDPEQFMSMTPEEVQAQAQQFIPKEIYKQTITVGSEALTVEFEKGDAN